MSHEFVYQCPHCEKNIQISDDVLGEVIDCPICESPFKVDVPSSPSGRPDGRQRQHAAGGSPGP